MSPINTGRSSIGQVIAASLANDHAEWSHEYDTFTLLLILQRAGLI